MPLQYGKERPKRYRMLDVTSVTVEEVATLVLACDRAFLHHMAAWPLAGNPRTGRRYRPYANGPRPSPEDRWLFVRMSLTQTADNQRVARRRIPVEHVISRVKRCRLVKDTIQLWTAGRRDIVREVCCALHNCRLRLTPWPHTIHESR